MLGEKAKVKKEKYSRAQIRGLKLSARKTRILITRDIRSRSTVRKTPRFGFVPYRVTSFGGIFVRSHRYDEIR